MKNLNYLTLMLLLLWSSSDLHAQDVWKVDSTFNVGTGANESVRSIAQQPDGKILIGGFFTTYNGTVRTCIARLNANGSLDTTFNPGPGKGASDNVNSITLQSDGKILIGGSFTVYNGSTRNRVARLNTDGSFDTGFNLGTGANNSVNSVALQSDGKILIGGSFTSYNGTTRNGIARLNADGSLDAGFNPGTASNGSLQSITLQPDGKVVIGGSFTSYNGTARNRIARLNADGSLDTGFNPGSGANSSIRSIVLQSDGKILIGGDFVSYNDSTRNRIARLNADGTLDFSFNPGSGANNIIASIALQSDGKVFIGGVFTSFNNNTRNYLARLNANGSLDTGFDPGTGPNATVTSIVQQMDGLVLVGGEFTSFSSVIRNRIARISNHCLLILSISNTGSTAICAGDSIKLSGPQKSGISYLWSTGQTDSVIFIKTSQSITLRIIQGACTSNVSLPVNVSIKSLPTTPVISGNPSFCSNESTTLSGPSGTGLTYLWSTGAATQNISFTQSASDITLRTIANGCTSAVSQPIEVVAMPPYKPFISASGPLHLCTSENVNLTGPATPGLGYVWSTGATTPSITVGSTQSITLRTVFGTCTSAVSNPVQVRVSVSLPGPGTTIVANYTEYQNCVSCTQKEIASIALSCSGGQPSTPPGEIISQQYIGTYNDCDYYKIKYWDCNGKCNNSPNNGGSCCDIKILNLNTVTAGQTTEYYTPLPTGGLDYQLKLIPNEAGTINIISNERVSITWSSSYAGDTASVSVIPRNGCGNGTESAGFTVRVRNKPSITGPKTLCLNALNTVYKSTTAGLPSNVSWQIQPVQAAFISPSADSVTVDWNNTFSGKAILTATNDIGKSETHEVTILSTACSAPTVLGVNPLSGTAGTVVTLTGIQLAGTYALSVGGVVVPDFTQVSATEVRFTVPAGALTGTVSITTPGGKATSSQTFTVINCGHTAQLVATSQTTYCAGDSVALAVVPVTGAGYQWYRNATPVAEANSMIYYAKQTGNYTCRITASGCPVMSSGVVLNFNAPQAATVAQSGAASCSGGLKTLTASGGYAGYLWSTGSTASFIHVSEGGAYSLEVTDANGCKSTQLVDVNMSNLVLDATPLCVVSVDESTGKNRIIWNKPTSVVIDSFIIYRETVKAGVYLPLAAVHYSAMSAYTDQTANPAIRAWRYRLALKDTCGNVSNLSALHKTMHLTINKGLGNAWNLLWDPYQGFEVPTYYIWRKTSTEDWLLIDSLPGNVISYSDFNVPGNVTDYQIEAISPNTCAPSGARMAGASSTLSNVVNVLLTDSDSPVSVQKMVFEIYPNPSSGSFNALSTLSGTLEIYAISGKLLLTQNLAAGSTAITTGLPSGMYLLRMSTAGGTYVEKLVIE